MTLDELINSGIKIPSAEVVFLDHNNLNGTREVKYGTFSIGYDCLYYPAIFGTNADIVSREISSISVSSDKERTTRITLKDE